MKKTKNILLVNLVVLLLMLTVGCGHGQETVKKGGGYQRDGGGKGSQPGVTFTAQDQQRLVQINVRDGQASMSFNLEHWDRLARSGELNPSLGDVAMLQPGPLTVNTVAGPVQDACIAQVAGLDPRMDEYFIMPSVVLLMADGSLEWFAADPFDLVLKKSVSSSPLPWLKNITALAYEQEKEGIGEMTVFAVDQAGLHYDVRIPHSYIDVFQGVLTCHMAPDWADREIYMLSLDLDDQGVATLRRGWAKDKDSWQVFKGQYTIYLDDEASQGRRPGMISFDLAPMQDTAAEAIKGTYFSEANMMAASLNLWLSEGDLLHPNDLDPADHYQFYFNYTSPASGELSWMDDQQLIDYVLTQVPRARQLVQEHGMAAMVIGETTGLAGEGECRDVWLGTDKEHSFVREILYTVSLQGVIYEYDPVQDQWDLVQDQ